MTDSPIEPLFVWHDSATLDQIVDYTDDDDTPYNSPDPNVWVTLHRQYSYFRTDLCPFCFVAYELCQPDFLTKSHYYRPQQLVYNTRPCCHYCSICGFWYSGDSAVAIHGTSEWFEIKLGLLRELNDERLGLAELGTHLKRRFRDICHLAPHRFEQLVADVFRHLDYDAVVTQQTRDGGYDILLLEKTSGHHVIVECKRYGEGRKVDVGIVRKLLGVQLERGVSRAKIVTTSGFTVPAEELAASLQHKKSIWELELIDAGRLLTLLNIYNKELPPLECDSRFCEK